jgi:hypothetical protein
MAHIVSCMVDADGGESTTTTTTTNPYIQKPASPQPPNDLVCKLFSSLPLIPPYDPLIGLSYPAYTFTSLRQQLTPAASEKQSFVWRMHHPEVRKYQLFPKDRKLPQLPSGKGLDPEQAFALAMGQTGEKSEKTTAGSGLRLRINQHNLTRRRKVSVPELGPMTTVQEVAMDSRMSSLL